MESRWYAQSATLLLEAGTDGGKKKPIWEYANKTGHWRMPSQLGKGLGISWFETLVELLFNDPGVTKIQTDVAEQLATIRCYESGV